MTKPELINLNSKFYTLTIFALCFFWSITAFSQDFVRAIDISVARQGCQLASSVNIECQVVNPVSPSSGLISISDYPTIANSSFDPITKYLVTDGPNITSVTSYAEYNFPARAKFLTSAFFDAEAVAATEIRTGLIAGTAHDLVNAWRNRHTLNKNWLKAAHKNNARPSIFVRAKNGRTTVIDLNQVTYSNLAKNMHVGMQLGWTIDRAYWLRNSDKIENEFIKATKASGLEQDAISEKYLVNWQANETAVDLIVPRPRFNKSLSFRSSLARLNENSVNLLYRKNLPRFEMISANRDEKIRESLGKLKENQETLAKISASFLREQETLAKISALFLGENEAPASRDELEKFWESLGKLKENQETLAKISASFLREQETLAKISALFLGENEAPASRDELEKFRESLGKLKENQETLAKISASFLRENEAPASRDELEKFRESLGKLKENQETLAKISASFLRENEAPTLRVR